ncbi:DUF3310 domain-containing protein [Nocardia sp. NPDC059246]|uniref:DUF3310 domain-containing protein n=1 Tax=unclassified Nocardia TaxID=2637762 RepID=UPI0036A7C1CE
MTVDVVNHPVHYGTGRFTCECIAITRHMTFNAGNAFKYVWRHQEKNGLEDLRKAAVYLRWSIEDQEELSRSAALPGLDGFVQDLIGVHVLPFAVGPYEPLIDIAKSNFGEALRRVESAINAYKVQAA